MLVKQEQLGKCDLEASLTLEDVQRGYYALVSSLSKERRDKHGCRSQPSISIAVRD